jgi:peptidoglycan/xylan/chitin deacetylase (PgdA/CDA1 family)
LPSRSPESGPAVALTFDAGADRGYAEDILDTLRAAGVPASFGVTGRWAEENPDLVRRMAADGHQIINHTVDHRSFTGLSDEMGGLPAAKRRQELEDADAILAPLIGHTTRPWYRLPYGDDADGISADVASTGFTRKAGWTIDSLGWRGLAAGDIVARCLKLAEPDAIYVFHVGSTSQDGLALARIIAGVREHGLAAVDRAHQHVAGGRHAAIPWTAVATGPSPSRSARTAAASAGSRSGIGSSTAGRSSSADPPSTPRCSSAARTAIFQTHAASGPSPR